MKNEVSDKRRKMRFRQFNAPLHVRRKNLSAHLSPKFLGDEKVHYPRSAVIKKGDTVRIMRGSEKGKEGKVTEVETKTGKVTIEGITIAKADKTQVSRRLHASNLMITKLALEDPWRRKRLEGGKE